MDKILYDLMDWAEIEAIVYSEHDHPEMVLGPHKVKNGILVQTFLPGAKSVFLKRERDGKLFRMEEADEAGFFAVLLPGRKIFAYEFIAHYGDGEEKVHKDPYQYPPFLTEETLDRFSRGKHGEIYRYLGAQLVTASRSGTEIQYDRGWKSSGKNAAGNVRGTHFAVWAPNAMRVSVVGDFNDWDGRIHPMEKRGDSGVFTLFIPDVGPGELYKYEIKWNARTVVFKRDPYGFRCEVAPDDANIVTDLNTYVWKDEKWLLERGKFQAEREPVSIYEVYLGNWRKEPSAMGKSAAGEEATGWKNYREIAVELAEHILKMGYTHVELLPVTEYLEEDSLGYRVSGYYAVSSRFGTPEDFMYFVDYLHGKGIGVILDWNISSFPKDAGGLAQFDGTCLYEHLDPRQGEYFPGQVKLYNYARPQVANFLQGNALFWAKIYHVDGLRIPNMDLMLYLDYGKGPGEWVPNELGGRENLAAVEFIQKLCHLLHTREKGILLIGEEKGAWPGVTRQPEEKGLGLDFKWNRGWTRDFLEYLKLDPYFRKGSHERLLFSMIYAYSEKFMLSFDREEMALYGGALLDNMPGEWEQKFANLRVAYGYMMVHPGKKLTYMEQELGGNCQSKEPPFALYEREGSEYTAMEKYIHAWNEFYASHPSLYDNDYQQDGFEWISCLDANHSILAFVRRDREHSEELLVVCNFTPVLYENYKVGVPYQGTYREVFNSEEEEFGGTGYVNKDTVVSKPVAWDGREYSINIDVPPMGVSVWKICDRKTGVKA